MNLKIKDLDVYYQSLGKGPDIVLLHGWGQDVSTWWGVAEDLCKYGKLWMIDLPGFGRSQTPSKAFGNTEYAEVIEEFIEKNKIKNPILIGHSLGGRVVIKMAARKQYDYPKIILEDAAGIKPKQDGIKPLIYLGAKIFKYLVPNIGTMKQVWRAKFYNSLEADYVDAGQMKGTLTRLLSEDLRGELSKITAETLIIWGEVDRAVPVSDGQLMYRKIENSRLEIIDGVGHFPHLEERGKFLNYVEDFVS